MKKYNSSKTSVSANSVASVQVNVSNVVTGNGIFTFSNGDRYEGEYVIFKGANHLVREGCGVYHTDDFNKYECKWKGDKISSDLLIRFNNDTEYKGSVDENGKMNGRGIYSLPDGSTIEGEWRRNKLDSNVRYKEPLGFIWPGELSDDKKVSKNYERQFMNVKHVQVVSFIMPG